MRAVAVDRKWPQWLRTSTFFRLLWWNPPKCELGRPLQLQVSLLPPQKLRSPWTPHNSHSGSVRLCWQLLAVFLWPRLPWQPVAWSTLTPCSGGRRSDSASWSAELSWRSVENQEVGRYHRTVPYTGFTSLVSMYRLVIFMVKTDFPFFVIFSNVYSYSDIFLICNI